MQVDVICDLVCPWCYIGKRRLEKALASRPALEIEISWRPFQLNPDMPTDGMAREAYLAAKFGGAGHAHRIYQAVAEAGASVAIPFAFDRIRRTPSTRDAHRLIRLAAREGRADALVEALFRAYFVEGRDLGERGTLADIAAEAGLERSAARVFLESTAGLDLVLAEDRGARRLGINAVPCYIFERQYAISGAQEPEFFFPVFDLIQNATMAAAP
jgi:predicted DsbA family dithiol-disulfide isomerase